MKKIILLSVALLIPACATTSAGTPSDLAAIRASLDELRAENASLKEKLEAKQTSSSAAPIVMMGPAAVADIPPGNPQSMGPPQNWAWMHQPPLGCKEGPFRLTIKNTHYDLYFKVLLDGEDVIVRGSRGNLTVPGSTATLIPPNAEVSLCLNDIGEHTVSGIAYAALIHGELKEIKRFHVTTSFGTRYGPRGHVFVIDDRHVR